VTPGANYTIQLEIGVQKEDDCVMDDIDDDEEEK